MTTLELERKRQIHHWTDEENDLVRRDYQGTRLSTELIAIRLGVHSWQAVKSHCQTLGVARHTHQCWTPDEIETLAALITQYSPKEVARRMHRSLNSVVVKSKKLHLSRRARDGWFTQRDVCLMFGVDHRWIQARIDSGALKARPHSDLQPKQNGGAMWHILTKDLRDFIIRYPGELQGRNVDIESIVYVITEVL